MHNEAEEDRRGALRVAEEMPSAPSQEAEEVHDELEEFRREQFRRELEELEFRRGARPPPSAPPARLSRRGGVALCLFISEYGLALCFLIAEYGIALCLAIAEYGVSLCVARDTRPPAGILGPSAFEQKADVACESVGPPASTSTSAAVPLALGLPPPPPLLVVEEDDGVRSLDALDADDEQEADGPPPLVGLLEGGPWSSRYEVNPSVESLSRLTEKQRASVSVLTVRRRGFGRLIFKKVDVRGVDFSVINIGYGFVEVYGNGGQAGVDYPALGSKLNRRATIVLNVDLGEGAKLESNLARLARQFKAKGGRLVGYDAALREVRLIVRQFSRHSVVDLDLEDEGSSSEGGSGGSSSSSYKSGDELKSSGSSSDDSDSDGEEEYLNSSGSSAGGDSEEEELGDGAYGDEDNEDDDYSPGAGGEAASQRSLPTAEVLGTVKMLLRFLSVGGSFAAEAPNNGFAYSEARLLGAALGVSSAPKVDVRALFRALNPSLVLHDVPGDGSCQIHSFCGGLRNVSGDDASMRSMADLDVDEWRKLIVNALLASSSADGDEVVMSTLAMLEDSVFKASLKIGLLGKIDAFLAPMTGTAAVIAVYLHANLATFIPTYVKLRKLFGTYFLKRNMYGNSVTLALAAKIANVSVKVWELHGGALVGHVLFVEATSGKVVHMYFQRRNEHYNYAAENLPPRAPPPAKDTNYLGAKVAKSFNSVYFEGVVVKRWGDEGGTLFRVKYSDGDREDVYLKELLTMIALHATEFAAASGGPPATSARATSAPAAAGPTKPSLRGGMQGGFLH